MTWEPDIKKVEAVLLANLNERQREDDEMRERVKRSIDLCGGITLRKIHAMLGLAPRPESPDAGRPVKPNPWRDV